jgi:RNA-binding protein YlmH
LESQIELNQVYLNQDLLKNISKNTNGKYFHWDDRDELLKLISPKVRREFKADIIKLTESRFVLIMLIILLCIEWTLRRIKGLI